jgi:hypothetical protein
MTKAEEILEIQNPRFVEPTFADLIHDEWTDIIISAAGDQGRLLIDEKDDPLALALGDGSRWNVGSFHLRKPTAGLIERFEETAGEIWQENRETWAEAVREYYSIELVHSIKPSIEDLNPNRSGMVAAMIAGIWGQNGDGARCIDFCCGSGVGASVLRQYKFSPLCFDNDPSLLSLGLAKKRLLPEETMLIDGRIASRYIRNATFGLGLMFGDINTFTEELWEQIVSEIISLTSDTIITTGTEKEARLVGEWATSRDRVAEITENRRDPIYDRWVCHVMRK